MIFFDVTKSAESGHRSGLMRLSKRLLGELGPVATPVAWPRWSRPAAPADWFLTAELFSEAERPGLREFLRRRSARCAAVFPDAIPLKHPHITWPHSVARHPDYMKLLSEFDRVWAISEASREELTGFWRWQGISTPPPVDVLALGADFNSRPRSSRELSAEVSAKADPVPKSLLCVGILEPRKNQSFLLDVCEELWAEGLAFELHLAGRVNPHFGRPLLRRIRALRARYPGLHHYAALDDAGLERLYGAARASVLPTLAEGCGLPLLESLWMGVPVVCSDLPVLRENADGGGSVAVSLNDRSAWKSALHRILTDDAWHGKLAKESAARPLPMWRDAATTLREALV